MHTAVRFRAYPTAAQQQLWARHAGAARVVFNLSVDQTRMSLDAGRGFPGYQRQCDDLKALRNDPNLAPWLRDTPAQVLQQALRDADRAWRNTAHGARRPRFRRRNNGYLKFRVPQHFTASRESRRWGTVTMPGTRERLKVRWHRTPPGKVKSATYVREPDGTYWVSLACKTKDRAPTRHRNDRGPVGVDLGVAVPVATSDGDLDGFTALTPKERERLRRLKRQLARRPKTRLPDGRRVDGANRRKTKQQIAKLKARARRRRHDFAEQTSARLANNHGVIAFENLNVKAMTRSARGTVDNPGSRVRQKAGLNRAIADVGWGRIIERTKQKATRRGGTVVQVDPRHTSQTCPDCGAVDPSQRVTRSRYECRVCGYTGHADTGAARNILQRALTGGLVAGVAHGTGVAARGDLQTSVGSAKREQANGHSTTQTAA